MERAIPSPRKPPRHDPQAGARAAGASRGGLIQQPAAAAGQRQWIDAIAGSPAAIAQRAWCAGLEPGPRMVAQRRLIRGLFGGPALQQPSGKPVLQRETYDASWEVQTPGLSLFGGAINWASGASQRRSRLQAHFVEIQKQITAADERVSAQSDLKDAFAETAEARDLHALRAYHGSTIGYAQADTLLAAATTRLDGARQLVDRIDKTLKRILVEQQRRQQAAQAELDRKQRRARHEQELERHRLLKEADRQEKAAAERRDRDFEALQARVLKALGGSEELKREFDSRISPSELDEALASGRLVVAASDLKAVRVVVPFAGSLALLQRLLAVAGWQALQMLVPKSSKDHRDAFAALLELLGTAHVAQVGPLLDAAGRGSEALLGRLVTRVGQAEIAGLLELLNATLAAKGGAPDAEALLARVHGQPDALGLLSDCLRLYPYATGIGQLLVAKPDAAVLKAVLALNQEVALSFERILAVLAHPQGITLANDAARMQAALQTYYTDARADLTSDSLARVLADGVARVQYNEEYRTQHERTYGGYSQEFKILFNGERENQCGWVVHIHHLPDGGNKGHVKSWADRTLREDASRIALAASVYAACRTAAPRWGA